MYSLCTVCGRKYTGLGCLRCTQTSISLVGFGDETLGAQKKPSGLKEIEAKVSSAEGIAGLKLPDGQLFGVPKPSCRIGTDPENDIVINLDETVSRFHAQIIFNESDKEYAIRDLGSSSGTHVNGSAISLDELIWDGDMIKIGKHKFYFVSDQES